MRSLDWRKWETDETWLFKHTLSSTPSKLSLCDSSSYWLVLLFNICIEMEKTFGETKIEFKDSITMKEFQKLSLALKEYQANNDEVWLAFKLFPIVAVKINWEELPDEKKTEWIENLKDFNVFNDICSEIWELQQKYMWGIDEKKKA